VSTTLSSAAQEDPPGRVNHDGVHHHAAITGNLRCDHAGRVGSKATDFYAFSWDCPGSPACNLIETAQRKSHPLGVEQAVVSPAAILITATPVGRSYRGRTVHRGVPGV